MALSDDGWLSGRPHPGLIGLAVLPSGGRWWREVSQGAACYVVQPARSVDAASLTCVCVSMDVVSTQTDNDHISPARPVSAPR